MKKQYVIEKEIIKIDYIYRNTFKIHFNNNNYIQADVHINSQCEPEYIIANTIVSNSQWFIDKCSLKTCLDLLNKYLAIYLKQDD